MIYTAENWPSDRWPNFPAHEMACKETGELAMNAEFMDMLQLLRLELGFAMVVSSGYRSARHSIEKRKAIPGAHNTGMAADILINGHNADRLVRAAMRMGFSGIGVKQHGDHSRRFIHLDTVRSGNQFARPLIWSYA